jgi:hypothetical protein
MQDEDTHVALLVAGSQLTGRVDKTWVPTAQVAPLLLRALGIEKFDLQALHREQHRLCPASSEWNAKFPLPPQDCGAN